MFQEIPASKTSISGRKPIHGIGINDSEYNVRFVYEEKNYICPYYAVWSGILTRCYSKKSHKINPTYTNCTVCEDWKLFSNFKKWMQSQDWQNKHLDKDILIEGNKIYSPETCVFVTQELNNLLLMKKTNNGKYSIGVSYDSRRNLFESCVSIKGKKKFLGYFTSESEACSAYISAKKELIISIALQQTNIQLKDALMTRANTL